MFYQHWMEQQAQKLVDATARAFTANRMLAPGGMAGGIPMVSFSISQVILSIDFSPVVPCFHQDFEPQFPFLIL
jgi:hypothetical protein